MKTKNILKIGVLSIILLSLLISPILKLGSQKAIAQEDCKSIHNQAYCRENCVTGDVQIVGICPEGQKCCLNYDLVTIDQTIGGEVKTVDVTGTAKELKATEICSWLIYNKATPPSTVWSILTGSSDDLWWSHKVCTFQIGALEGIGKMIAGMINSLTAQIFWALDPNTYGGFVKNAGVVEIWGILRDFMNLALILILIIIAVSTILGIKKYRWQEILWKLVLIALLINFSLILPGVLLDISHFITYTFINLTQNLNNNESIAQTVMNLYRTDEISGPEKYSASYGDTMGTIEVGEDIKTKIKIEREGWGLAWGNFFLVLAALALIGLFAFISLIAIFFVMMFRSFIIIILLAVSPIAFAAWVLPNTQKFWELWWGQFTRWCLFPITFAISLYAGIIVLNGMHDSLAKMGTSNSKLGIIAMIVQIILFSMFLIGGLVVSIQSSGAVGKVAQKQVSRAGWLAGVFATKKIVGGIQKTQVYRAAGQKLTHVPLISSIGHGMIDKSDSVRLTNDIKKYEKEMEESRNRGMILDTANRKAPSRLNRDAYAHYMAARNIAMKKGWLNNDDYAVNAIRNDISNDNPDLNAVAIRNAFPQYFKITNGKLEEIDQEANDYHDQVINNLKAMNPTDLPKKTEKIITAVGGDINKFLGKLVQLKTNQFRAFLDNVDEEEYNQGNKAFKGTSSNPKPWYGPNGEIVKRLKAEEIATLGAYSNATNSNGSPKAGYTSTQVKALEKEWIEADQALTALNNKLKTSPSLKETLGTNKV